MTLPRPSPAGLRYLSRRLVGGLVDFTALAGVQLGIVRAITALTPPTVPGHHFSDLGILLFGALAPTAWLAYAVVPLWRNGTSLGKQIAGLRVVNRHGRTPTFSQAFWRESAGRWLCAMSLYLAYLWPLWDQDRQGVHDMLAETYVVLDDSRARH